MNISSPSFHTKHEGLAVVSSVPLAQVEQISAEVKSNQWECDSETAETCSSSHVSRLW